MTIGSKKGSARRSLRAPKFLDKSSGFYGRLREPDEVPPSDTPAVEEEEEEEVAAKAVGRAGGFDANDDGATEGDDGETLLHVKLGRSRWSRRCVRRKRQTGDTATNTSSPDGSLAPGAEEEEEAAAVTPSTEVTASEPTPGALVVHFAAREDADDQVLIRDKKRGREEEEEGQGGEEEGEEERRLRREQEEGMKALKRKSVKNYRKALDRAFRRGWEAFVTNLYSVTLTPVAASAATHNATATTTTTTTTTTSTFSKLSSKKKAQSSVILSEFI